MMGRDGDTKSWEPWKPWQQQQQAWDTGPQLTITGAGNGQSPANCGFLVLSFTII